MNPSAISNHRVAIAVGQLKGQRRQVRHLLHRVRRQHDRAVVAVAAALHHLVIVALLGADVAQPGPPRVMSAITQGSSAPAM